MTRRIHQSLFYLLLILLPVQLNYYVWPDFSYVHGVRIDYLSPTVYLTSLIMIGVIFFWFADKRWEIVPKSMSMLALLLATIGSNVIVAQQPALAAVKSIQLLLYGCAGWYVYKTLPSRGNIMRSLFIATMYTCVLAWMQFVNQSSIGGLFWWMGERTFDVSTPGIATAIMHNQLILRPYATFSHPNVLAGFLVAMLPLVFSYNAPWYKQVQIPLAIIIIATVGITYSRSAWIVMTFLFLFYTMRTRNKHFPVPLILSALVLAGLVLPFASERFLNLFSVDAQSITRRVDLTRTAGEMIMDHPLTGVGYFNFIPALSDYVSIASYQDLQPVHTIYLLFAAEWGIVGIISICGALYLLRTMRFTAHHAPYTLSISTLLVLGLFDHYPYTAHQILIFIALLLGMIASLSNKINHATIEP